MRVLLFLLLLVPVNIFAQEAEKKFQLEVSYGLLSSSQLRSMSEYVVAEVVTLGYADSRESYRFTGPLFISGRYFVTSWLGLGLTAGFEIVKADVVVDQVFIGRYKYNSKVAALEIQFRYLNLENFQLYSGFSNGFRMGKEIYPTDEGIRLNQIYRWTTQLNFIGMRFGSNIGGYFEFGYGYKGLVNTGLYFRF